jgi:hypothetical protein
MAKQKVSKKVGGSCGNARNSNAGRECPITLRSREELCQLGELESRVRLFRVCEVDVKRCKDPTFYDADALAQWALVDGKEEYPHNRAKISEDDKERLRALEPHVPLSVCGVAQQDNAYDEQEAFSSMSELRADPMFLERLRYEINDYDGVWPTETSVSEWLESMFEGLQDKGYTRAAVQSIVRTENGLNGWFRVEPGPAWVLVRDSAIDEPQMITFPGPAASSGTHILYANLSSLEYRDLAQRGGGASKKAQKVRVPGVGERVVHVRDRKKMVKVGGAWVPLKEALVRRKK